MHLDTFNKEEQGTKQIERDREFISGLVENTKTSLIRHKHDYLPHCSIDAVRRHSIRRKVSVVDSKSKYNTEVIGLQ